MEENNIFNSKNVKTIIVFGLIFAILALTISLIQPPKFKSSSKLLVVVNQDSIDSYTASRTADYISNILSEVVYSNSFIDNVIKSQFNIEDDFGITPEQRIKNWEKRINIKTKENQGIIFIEAFHTNKDQAHQLAQAVSYTLITKHEGYHGMGSRVSVKMIDSPMLPKQKDQPKIWLNTILGLAAGLIFSLTFVIIFPEQKLYRIFVWRGFRDDEMMTLESHHNYNQETIPDQLNIEENQNHPTEEDNKNIYNW